VDYDEKSLRVKRACFDSQAILPNLGFVSVDKLLLMFKTILENEGRKKLELVTLSVVIV